MKAGNKNITQLISSTTGAIINKYEYNPFGALAVNNETVDNPFKFSSEYNEKETGLVYYNYRFYDPSNGKWLSRDPIEEFGGANVYSINGNDTVDSIDLLGLREKWGDINFGKRLPRTPPITTQRPAPPTVRKKPKPAAQKPKPAAQKPKPAAQKAKTPSNGDININVTAMGGFEVAHRSDISSKYWNRPSLNTLEKNAIQGRHGFLVKAIPSTCTCKCPNSEKRVKGQVIFVQYVWRGGDWKHDGSSKIWKDGKHTRQPAYTDPDPKTGKIGIHYTPKGYKSYIDSPSKMNKFMIKAYCRCDTTSDQFIKTKVITHDPDNKKSNYGK